MNLSFYRKNNDCHYKIPFTSMEYFITSHKSKYDDVNLTTTIKSILKIFLSIFGSLNLRTNIYHEIIYHGGKKTEVELDKISAACDHFITLSDSGLRLPDAAKRSSSLLYFFRPHFLGNMKKILTSNHFGKDLKFFLVSDLIWNYGYFNQLSKITNSDSKVISFFQTSTMAIILREFCRVNNIDFIYYSWGSNIGTSEFQHGSSDITLVKNYHDKALFSKYKSYKKLIHIGDLSLEAFSSTSDLYLPQSPKVLILDTCLSEYMNLEKKELLYKEVVSRFKSSYPTFFIRPHPASSIEGLNRVISEIGNNAKIIRNGSIFDNAKLVDIVANINSTAGNQLVFKGFPVLEINDLEYGENYIKPSHPGVLASRKSGEILPGDKIFDSAKLDEYIKDLGVKAVTTHYLRKVIKDEK